MTQRGVLRCIARTARGRLCNGFVGHFSRRVVDVRLIASSREKRPGSEAAGCLKCGALHEIRLTPERPLV